MHKTLRRNQKTQKAPSDTFPIPGTDEPLRTRWQTTCYPCLKQRTRGNMLFDPTERNVNPILFPTRTRPMKKLVLTSAIHDKYVTMAETPQVSFIIRTGPTLPSEDCGASKTHRNDELGFTGLSKQKFVIAMPTDTRVPPR